ncbi:hypothetical protein [Oceanobacter mangrovi]|uniref:hypothetical protein n=1 Tax=Oceanobacter mangrovi TaxID=2862510 RepID=UPI001C8DB8C7|nr:hypothetical protein [Oceanobacter mangrovi]
MSGAPVDVATLINGCLLVIAADALALYREGADLRDPLGNGLIRSAVMPEICHMAAAGGFVQEYRAGYVGLANDLVLLIGLNDVRLFLNKQDALRNMNEQLRLSLEY